MGISHGVSHISLAKQISQIPLGIYFVEKSTAKRCFFLEQGTGIEPAFTAWEAVVLPIYESCIGAIIAEAGVKFNPFLSIAYRFFHS